MSAAEVPVGRRERVRAATVDEIKSVALRLLVAEGPEAMTLRAIAREMGMTAPGLYRYFPSHDDLRLALVGDCYTRLTAVLEQARDAVPAPPGGEPDVALQLVAAAKAFRGWAAENPREFALVFGAPVPSMAPDAADDPAQQAGLRFGAVWSGIFLRHWARTPFPVPADDELAPDLARQLAAYRDVLVGLFGAEAAGGMPLGAVHAFMRAWVQLYGLVAMEVFDHLHFCFDDVGPFFERSLMDLGRELGIAKDHLAL